VPLGLAVVPFREGGGWESLVSGASLSGETVLVILGALGIGSSISSIFVIHETAAPLDVRERASSSSLGGNDGDRICIGLSSTRMKSSVSLAPPFPLLLPFAPPSSNAMLFNHGFISSSTPAPEPGSKPTAPLAPPSNSMLFNHGFVSSSTPAPEPGSEPTAPLSSEDSDASADPDPDSTTALANSSSLCFFLRSAKSFNDIFTFGVGGSGGAGGGAAGGGEDPG
jgi:hypothetical protein